MEKAGSQRCAPIAQSRSLDDLAELLLAFMIESHGGRTSIKMLLEGLERRIIMDILLKCGGNQAQAARFLNIKTTTLGEKIKRYGILTEIKRSISPKKLFLNRLILREQRANQRPFHSAGMP